MRKLKSLLINLRFKRSTLRTAALLSLMQGVSGVIVYFFSIRIVIEYEGLELMGLWTLVFGAIAFLRLFDVFNPGSLVRLLPISDPRLLDRTILIDSIALASALYYLLAAFLFLAISPALLPSLVDEDYLATAQDLIPWISVCFLTSSVMSVHTSALDGVGRPDLRARFMLLGHVVLLAGTTVMVPTIGLSGYAAAQIAQQVLCATLARRFLAQNVIDLGFLPTKFSFLELKTAAVIGTKLQLVSAPLLIYEPMIRIVVNSFAGLSVLALYDLAYKLASYTRLLLESALTPLVPEFSRSSLLDVRRSTQLYGSAFRISIPATVLAYVMLIAFAPFGSVFLLGYMSSEFLAYVAALSFSWGIASLGVVPKLFARATDNMRWNMAGEWSIAILTISFATSFAVKFGNEWIVLGISAGIAVGSMLALLGNQRTFKKFVSDLPTNDGS